MARELPLGLSQRDGSWSHGEQSSELLAPICWKTQCMGSDVGRGQATDYNPGLFNPQVCALSA